MTKTVSVPVSEVAALLGLDPGTDKATVLGAMERFLSQRRKENARRADDEKTVAAAIRDGRISASRRGYWLNALRQDRPGARRVLGSLTAVPPNLVSAAAATAPDPELADKMRVFKIITGQEAPPEPVTPTIRPRDRGAVAASSSGSVRIPAPSAPQPQAPARERLSDRPNEMDDTMSLGGHLFPADADDAEIGEWHLWHMFGRQAGQPPPRQMGPMFLLPPSDSPTTY
jgi:hypothetical protein